MTASTATDVATPASDRGELHVVLATDRHYVMPLAVAICSTALHCMGRSLAFVVIQTGVGDDQRARVERSLRNVNDSARIEWVDAPAERLASLKLAHSYTTSLTYARLLVGELLPAHVESAIYLDCDVVVREDIAELAAQDFAGRSLLAVRDYSTTTVSSPFGIRNHRDLGIPPDAPYFNAGVLVVNVAKWRREAIGERLFRHLALHERVLQMADQEALNAVLFGDWGELDYRWNWQIPWRKYRTGRVPAPWVPDTSRQSIVHFTTAEKPWLPGCDYEEKRFFFEHLDRTDWAGWRIGWRSEICGRASRAVSEARSALGALRRRLSPQSIASLGEL